MNVDALTFSPFGLQFCPFDGDHFVEIVTPETDGSCSGQLSTTAGCFKLIAGIYRLQIKNG